MLNLSVPSPNVLAASDWSPSVCSITSPTLLTLKDEVMRSYRSEDLLYWPCESNSNVFSYFSLVLLSTKHLKYCCLLNHRFEVIMFEACNIHIL